MKKHEKWITYAVQIQSALQEAFDRGDIDVKEFEDSENFKQFLHALSTVVPAKMYCSLTGEESNYLEFNQLANTLCFEYMTKEPEPS